MDGAPAKPKGRKRAPKKAEGAPAAGAGRAGSVAAAAAPAAARPTATEATATEQTEQDEATQPQPTLSQRLAKSLKQLSQLGGGSKAEQEGDEVEQEPLRGQAQEPVPPEPADQGGEGHQHPAQHMGETEEEEEEEGGGTPRSRLRRLGHRLSTLLPRGKLHPSEVLGGGWPGAALPAALVLLLLLLGGGLLAARQGRAHRSQLSSLQAQLAAQQAAAAASQRQLQDQVAALERSLDQLGARLGASAGQLAALEHTCGAQADAASDLRAELTTARDDISQLQLGAAAAAAQAGNASEAAAVAAAGGQRVRGVAREEVAAALETFAADRTGMPDYALAAAGGAVVAHSPAHLPPGAGQGAGGALGALYSKLQGGGVHPQASRLLLAPLSQPGACLPLVGPSGWVDVRLAQPIRPTAFTYEHIPASIAHDLRSAPRSLSLLGFLGKPPAPPTDQPQPAAGDAAAAGGSTANCAGCGAAGTAGALAAGGVLLGQWQYNVHSTHAVQTFTVDSSPLPAGGAIDHTSLAPRQWAGRRRRRCPPPIASSQGPRLGNENRLSGGSPGGGSISGGSAVDPSLLQQNILGGRSTERTTDSFDGGSPPPPEPAWHQAASRWFGELQYKYFNWRQDTWSDLQLFMLLNAAVFMAGAWVEGAVIRYMDESVAPPPNAGFLETLWYNLYKVLAVVLGQDLPPAEDAGWPSQIFAIITAIFGLASFALVLALIEQVVLEVLEASLKRRTYAIALKQTPVVLEVLEANVKRGSPCYESGHTVVLTWCESPRDIAQLTRILSQLCAANRREDGGVVVVLAQHRGKLEMEQLFREALPEESRYGTRFVFRQGSPLDPVALKMVAAPDSRRIIVCSDYIKASKDTDAQVLRACVLLDELIQSERPGGAGGPVVVAEIKTEDALPLVRYACSQRVLPVPTNKVNARRMVRLLHHPIAAVFSRCLTDFYSPAHGTIDRIPEVEGLHFRELHCRFPDALIVGLTNPYTGQYLLNPPPDHVVAPGDELIKLRSERSEVALYEALPPEASAQCGCWSPEDYQMRSHDEQPLGADACGAASVLAQSARASQAALTCAPQRPELTVLSGGRWGIGGTGGELYQDSRQGVYVLPVQYSDSLAAGELLICGWMGRTFMWELMAELDHSDQALPPGSKVTLFNDHNWSDEKLECGLKQYNIRNLVVEQVRGDPRALSDMRRLIDVRRYKAAIVVCDSFWVSEPSDSEGGLQLQSQAEMLACDSATLMVQLNIRLLLEEAGHPSISIICEKLTYVGTTRFEDDSRLPLGLSVNSASYAAKTLTQVAVNPRFLPAYMQVGVESDLVVQDSSAFASVGEELSFMQLQARAASVRQILMGYYTIPRTAEDPLEMVVNPQGLEARTKKRVWNAGDFRCKLVTMAVVKQRPPPEQDSGQPAVPAALAMAAAAAEAVAGTQQGAAELPAASASWEGGSLSSQEAQAEEGQAGPGDEWQAAASDYHAASEKFIRNPDQGQPLASGDAPPTNGRRAPFGSGSINGDWSLDE
ncbi:SAD1 UNC-84 domain 1- isoform A [Chlorella sorokiniana]|uniref:SAD1 UNC-84 domain 1-isoform A n=1 Tax=Chlorella sorokiniana TaxID=3076 RepID=A0A2P6TV73_CHLSO|nr:SAD1 UNC-84 domain 1- isoform A [Chlorella sorokiniana]|eukprot:PRW57972.1 SAD1 UNC-84 domain 1- isoform A [Chlorella sorokiniana]